MKKELQDDIAALCSHLSLDRSDYRVFTKNSPETAPAVSPDSAKKSEVDLAQVTDADQIEPPVSRRPVVEMPSATEESLFSEQMHKAARETARAGSRPSVRPLFERDMAPPVHPRRALQSIKHRSHPSPLNRGTHKKQQSISIFAASGGAGATTAAATLARILARGNEHILLADGRPDSILPVYFGGRIGAYSAGSYFPGHVSSGAPVHILGYSEDESQERFSNVAWLGQRLAEIGGEFDRLILDSWPTLISAAYDQSLKDGISIIVAVPDLQSVLGIERLARSLREQSVGARPVLVLNKFAANMPFHQEMRAWIEEHFREQFEYFTIAKSEETSEALAEGLTVVDFAPDSAVARDWNRVADYVAEPALTSSKRPGGNPTRAFRG